jgi:hypothetical protein
MGMSLFEIVGIEYRPDNPRPAWVGGADYYLSVEGEYERCGASWTYRKIIREALRFQHGDDFDVTAKLHVYGTRAGHRYRPTHWHVTVHFGKFEHHVVTASPLRGKCRSIADATRLAENVITPALVDALVAYVYRKNPRTQCVYRLKDAVRSSPEALLDPSNWEPWASDCLSSVAWARWLPPGEYLEVSRQDERLRGYHVKQSWDCTTGSGSRDWNAVAEQLGMWI